MATPQWVLLQRRIEPSQKSSESKYDKNTRIRQREAVRSALRKGFLKHLDRNMILQSVSEVDDLDQVKYISLPSSSVQMIDDLSILSSAKLCVVNLPYNYITDLNPFHSCVNLIKLDVSGNQIRDLPDSIFWTSLRSLKVLYLNNNIISNKEFLLNLSHCTSLQVLTMYDNPISLLSNYRHIAVNCILSLKALDYHVISDQEIIENLPLTGKFRAHAKPFHKLLYLPINKDDTLTDELHKIYQLLLSIDLVLSHYSPVVIIQRWIRGWLTRNKLLKCNTPQLRALVQHRNKGSEHVRKILKRSSMTPFTAKRREGRLGTSDLPLPPPCSPIPIPPLMKEVVLLERPGTKQVKKTIKETEEILSNGGLQQLKKRKMKKKRKKMDKKSNTCSNSDDVELGVFGEHQSVGKLNLVDHIRAKKKIDGKEIREAESEIKNIVVEMRQRVPVIEQQKGTWPKDSHAFIRAHATMSLSLLKDITRKQNNFRKENEITKKAEIVARVKEERERRKERIYNNQQMIRDTVMMWRISEERRLQERREHLELEQEYRQMKNAESLVKMVEQMKSKKQEEKMAITFIQQSNMLDKMVDKEKRKVLKKSLVETKTEHVHSNRVSAQEQADIVNRFMDMRQEKMRNDNSEAKEKLNAQMIQVASQQLLEAKQKVARVKSWREIAKTFKKEDKNTILPTNNLSNALESIPEADAVDVGLLGPLLQAYTSNGIKQDCNPQNMRGTTNEAHRTWQRGIIGMARDQYDYDDHYDYADGPHYHFPKIKPLSDLQPLMFDQLQPAHPYFHNIGTTPDNSYQTTPTSYEYAGRNSPMTILPPNSMHLLTEIDNVFVHDN